MSRAYAAVALALSILLPGACSEPPQPTINLYRAVQAGDLNQLERHLYWGTDINQTDSRGETPLHVAARRGRVIIARALLREGADPNAENATGQSPLQVALAEGKTQLAALLIEEGATDDPQRLLFDLVRDGVDDRDSLEFLTKRGARVDAKDEDGRAPLHMAVDGGRRLLTKRLIDLGADLDLPDETGRTALAIAATRGDRFIVDLLERSGARSEPESPANQ